MVDSEASLLWWRFCCTVYCVRASSLSRTSFFRSSTRCWSFSFSAAKLVFSSVRRSLCLWISAYNKIHRINSIKCHNSRLVQTEGICRWQNKLNNETIVKTFWQKEKMLDTSIFSFSHNIFKRLLFFFFLATWSWSTMTTNATTLVKSAVNGNSLFKFYSLPHNPDF